MKPVLFGLAMTFAAPLTHATTYWCNFTEPFAQVTYDTDMKELGLTRPNEEYLTWPSTHSKAGNFLTAKSINGEAKLRIQLNKKGSDGMSDHVYQYEGVWNDTLVGGCDLRNSPRPE
ncbi:hypothetical protein [Bdellovibrio sp. HCB209]|uniref:hypothetical protein n=1 Tax=Bdellovibrio sp. HCB209 TaxID=3394354 RepID=UPI0039B6C246